VSVGKIRKSLGTPPVTAIPLLEDFKNILASHFLARPRIREEWGKNMVGKNI
jgi:hypothetical protein